MQNHSTAAQTTTPDTFPAYNVSSLVQQTIRNGRSATHVSGHGVDSAARSFFGPVPVYPRHRSAAKTSPVTPLPVATLASQGVRDRTRLDQGWRFRVGDPADARELFTRARLRPIQGEFLSPLEDDSAIVIPRGQAAEESLGGSISWVRPEFGDDDWALINNFSDASSEIVVADETAAMWYRQSFKTPSIHREGKIILEVEELSPRTHLWINGQCLGSSLAGSASFRRDLTPYLVLRGVNTLVVRVAGGAGKLHEDMVPCRAISILKTGVLHASSHAPCITGAQRSGERAEIAVGTTLHNEQRNAQRGTMIATILDPAGRSLAEAKSAFHIFGGDRTLFEQKMTLHHVGWLAEDPGCYLVRTRIVVDDRILDEDITPFDLNAALSGTKSEGFIALEGC